MDLGQFNLWHKQFLSRLGDFRPVWDDFAPLFMQFERNVFKTSGAALGTIWPPLKPRYVAWKQRHGYRTEILQMTGRMMESLTKSGAADQILVSQKKKFIFGTARRLGNRKKRVAGDSLGRIHQDGINVPVRRFIPESVSELPDWLAQYLIDRFRLWIIEGQ